MSITFPIHIQAAHCHDCYKCVRCCPVKAIAVESGQARIIPEACVVCGDCYGVCPSHAVALRSEAERVKQLLSSSSSTPIWLSLAPSWITAFEGLHPSQLARAAKLLGFSGVSESALGAQEMVWHLTDIVTDEPKLHLTSVCPASLDYIRRYMPEFTENITPLLSPVQAHVKMLRARYGSNLHVVFAGSCIAAKNEADRNQHILEACITFSELKELFRHFRTLPESQPVGEASGFEPHDATDGSLYVVEGGVVRMLQNRIGESKFTGASVSGLAELALTLEGMKDQKLSKPVVLECWACQGSCVNAPGASGPESLLQRRLSIIDYVGATSPTSSKENADIYAKYVPFPLPHPEPAEEQVTGALHAIGKYSADDELDCAGCGYDTCREFATAMALGHAEDRMCISYMRKLAQKKANVLLATMPSGVVLVNAKMEIVDSNRRFAATFGEDNLLAFDVSPGLRGCRFDKIAPFGDELREVLSTGKEKHLRHLRAGNKLLDIAVFNIEPKQLVGAIVNDVTTQETQRGEIAKRANDVIKQNIATVQEIACTLGEHMAETEILLRAIAEGYGQSSELFVKDDFDELNKTV